MPSPRRPPPTKTGLFSSDRSSAISHDAKNESPSTWRIRWCRVCIPHKCVVFGEDCQAKVNSPSLTAMGSMGFGAGVVHHQMKDGTSVVGEALRKQRLDAVRNRSGQLINLIRADADGWIESMLWWKQVGEHVGLGERVTAGCLVGVVAAHIEIERCVGRVLGERYRPLTCAMSCIIELHDTMERGGEVEIGSNRCFAPDELLVALGFHIQT